MQIFQSQEVASHCTVLECADWLAFGRLPQPDIREVRPLPGYMERTLDCEFAESRITPWAIMEFEGSPSGFNAYFSRNLLLQLLPGIDADLYYVMAEKCGLSEPEDVREQIRMRTESNDKLFASGAVDESGKSFSEIFHPPPYPDLEDELSAAVWLHRTLAPVRNLLSRAKSEIFGALADGALVGQGVWLVTDDIRQESLETPWAEVPSGAWTLEGLDWNTSNLITLDGSYWGVAISTQSLLNLFPKPRIAPRAISGMLFGETIIQDGNSSDVDLAVSRSRGQPAKLESIAEGFLQKHLEYALLQGLTRQKEAMIIEGQDWARQHGVAVSRTAMDRIITRIMPKITRNVRHSA